MGANAHVHMWILSPRAKVSTCRMARITQQEHVIFLLSRLLCRCALFAGDRAAAAEVAFQMGGARAGQILPVVLTQRARNK